MSTRNKLFGCLCQQVSILKSSLCLDSLREVFPWRWHPRPEYIQLSLPRLGLKHLKRHNKFCVFSNGLDLKFGALGVSLLQLSERKESILTVSLIKNGRESLRRRPVGAMHIFMSFLARQVALLLINPLELSLFLCCEWCDCKIDQLY